MDSVSGTFEKHRLYHEKLPEQEYDPKGIPYGIQPDHDKPYLDSSGLERHVWVYRPSALEPLMLARSLFVVSDAREEQDIRRMMIDSGLMDLSERESAFLVFPLPSPQGWNAACDPAKPDDVDFIHHVLRAARLWFLFPGREKCHEYMMGMVAEGKGAEMAHVAIAGHPEHVSSLLSFGGTVTRQMLPNSFEDREMFVWTVNMQGDGHQFWFGANRLEHADERRIGNTVIRSAPDNRALQVRRSVVPGCGIDGGILMRFWDEAFSGNVRIPAVGSGHVFSFSEILEKYRPCTHIGDRSLGDNGGIPHLWYEFIPESVRARRFEPGFTCPLIVVMHGGGSWPAISAAKTQLHILGEERAFITVYANASAENSWNSLLRDDRINDTAFVQALVRHMLRSYPVDSSRVYVSGFSNGSGMAQVIAALHPEMVAGVIAFNTRYRIGEGILSLARSVKNGFDYRMPVFSTYGTLDAEYPPQENSGQFSQMRFWKWYNNIGQKPLLPDDPCGAGVPGDEIVEWGPPARDGSPLFTTHKYVGLDAEGINYYNYTIVRGLPHTVERRLIPEAWDFVSRFSRKPDGSLEIAQRKDGQII